MIRAPSISKLRQYSFSYLLMRSLHEVFEYAATFFWTFIFRTQCMLNGTKVGEKVEVFGRVIIRAPGRNVQIGNRCQFLSSSWRASFSGVSHPVRIRTFLPSAQIIFEDGSGMSGGSITARSQTIRIGRNTAIGPDCIISDSDFHHVWPPEGRNKFSGSATDKPIYIGNNVWLGARVMVLKGVTIGDNSVVAAGSVVTSNIPPNSLAAGVPAKVIKDFD